jgi:hypothetical protein
MPFSFFSIPLQCINEEALVTAFFENFKRRFWSPHINERQVAEEAHAETEEEEEDDEVQVNPLPAPHVRRIIKVRTQFFIVFVETNRKEKT